jgi:hypothetical protein
LGQQRDRIGDLCPWQEQFEPLTCLPRDFQLSLVELPEQRRDRAHREVGI